MSDPYIYSETNVLKNNFNIRDAERLAEVENDLVYFKLIELDEFFHSRRFNASTLKALHRYLFEDVYAWAGEYRTINIRKFERVLPGASVEYCDFNAIAQELGAAMKDLARFPWENMPIHERAAAFTKIFARIWKIHPFREGNTRTITAFMLGFAKRKRIRLNGGLLSKYNSYVRDSLVMASIGEYSEFSHLEKIILDAMGGDENTRQLMSADELHGEYSFINGYDVRDYYYREFDSESRKRD